MHGLQNAKSCTRVGFLFLLNNSLLEKSLEFVFMIGFGWGTFGHAEKQAEVIHV